MQATYVPGKGYTVRDTRGRVIAHGLSASAKDQLLKHAGAGVLAQSVLETIIRGA